MINSNFIYVININKQERMMLIEKLPAEALADGKLKNGYLSSLFNCMGGGLVSSVSLRFGCLLVGLGLGLLIGYCIVVETQPGYFMEN